MRKLLSYLYDYKIESVLAPLFKLVFFNLYPSIHIPDPVLP